MLMEFAGEISCGETDEYLAKLRNYYSVRTVDTTQSLKGTDDPFKQGTNPIYILKEEMSVWKER